MGMMQEGHFHLGKGTVWTPSWLLSGSVVILQCCCPSSLSYKLDTVLVLMAWGYHGKGDNAGEVLKAMSFSARTVIITMTLFTYHTASNSHISLHLPLAVPSSCSDPVNAAADQLTLPPSHPDPVNMSADLATQPP